MKMIEKLIQYTVEPALKDHSIGHENMVSPDKVVFDEIIYPEMYDLLPKANSPSKTNSPSRQVVSHGSGLMTSFTLVQTVLKDCPIDHTMSLKTDGLSCRFTGSSPLKCRTIY